ncbi:hypothetical protein OIU79_007852 [Salix purpurea]|uniref:Uncharacterized protein n=1 Tax=Salix purpurea TaxID=77065 RepID=A0A9Q0YVB4_SALPP|nr:hypothetical protein OIU79_007852 [Salix purpurea]
MGGERPRERPEGGREARGQREGEARGQRERAASGEREGEASGERRGLSILCNREMGQSHGVCNEIRWEWGGLANVTSFVSYPNFRYSTHKLLIVSASRLAVCVAGCCFLFVEMSVAELSQVEVWMPGA